MPLPNEVPSLSGRGWDVGGGWGAGAGARGVVWCGTGWDGTKWVPHLDETDFRLHPSKIGL